MHKSCFNYKYVKLRKQYFIKCDVYVYLQGCCWVWEVKLPVLRAYLLKLFFIIS